MVICAETGLVIDSLLEPEDGVQISVEEVEVEVPLQEALVSITRAPPAILGLSIEPPLPDTACLRFSMDGISVAAEDMLCVPDWVERRSLAARMIERTHLQRDEQPGALLFVDHTRYERIRLCLHMGEGAKGVEAGSSEPARGICTAAHVVKIRGLNLRKRTGDGLEWFMF